MTDIKIADVTLRLSYDVDKFIDAGEAEYYISNLQAIHESVHMSLGMSCEVCEENSDNEFVIHARLQHEKGTNTDERELARLDFLQSLAETYVIAMQEEGLQHKGVDFNINVAEHNKADFESYLLKYEIEFAVKQEASSSYEGDACIAVHLNLNDLIVEKGGTEAANFVDQFKLFIRTFAEETLSLYCGVNGNAIDNGKDIVYNLRLTIPEPKKQNTISFYLTTQQVLKKLRTALARITHAAHAEITVKNNQHICYSQVLPMSQTKH